MYKKFILLLLIGLSLSSGLSASDGYKTVSFQMDVDMAGTKKVFQLHDRLRYIIDEINDSCGGKYIGPQYHRWLDTPASNTPHVTLQIFKRISKDECFTKDETKTMFQQPLVSCVKLLKTNKSGVTLDDLKPIMILKLKKADGTSDTKYLRNNGDIEDESIYQQGYKFHSLTIALETKRADVLSCAKGLSELVKYQHQGNVDINQDYGTDVMHVTLLKFIPIQGDKVEAHKKTGGYVNEHQIVDGRTFTLLETFHRNMGFHAQNIGLNSLSCSSISLNPMRVKDPNKAPTPFRQPNHLQEMNMSTGCYPLSEACRTEFIAKYQKEFQLDKKREQDRKFTPKLAVVYQTLVNQASHPNPMYQSTLLPSSDYTEKIQKQYQRIQRNQDEIAEKQAKIAENLSSIEGQKKRIADNQNNWSKHSAGNIADAKEKISKYEKHISLAKEAIARKQQNIDETLG